MTRRFLLSVAVSLLLLGLLAGCANRCRQPFTATCPNRCNPCGPSVTPGVPPPPSAIPVAPAPAPVGMVAPAPPPDAGIPPAPGPTPGGSPLYPSGGPGASLSPAAPTPASPATPDTRFSSPAPQADQWQAAAPPSGAPQAGVRLSGPESAAPDTRESARPQTPGTTEPPVASAKPGVIEQRIPPAASPSAPSASPSLPVGIPEFAVIIPEKVTAGQKPSLEAFDWLKSNNYRTVLHLVKPGEPDGARAQVERRGLKYQTIEVSAQNLGKAIEEFNRAVSATDNQPLFVYDRDGTLAGPLWYLRFRTVDRLPDEEARRKATTLGLRDDGTGDSINLWVAIQEYLRKNGK